MSFLRVCCCSRSDPRPPSPPATPPPPRRLIILESSQKEFTYRINRSDPLPQKPKTIFELVLAYCCRSPQKDESSQPTTYRSAEDDLNRYNCNERKARNTDDDEYLRSLTESSFPKEQDSFEEEEHLLKSLYSEDRQITDSFAEEEHLLKSLYSEDRQITDSFAEEEHLLKSLYSEDRQVDKSVLQAPKSQKNEESPAAKMDPKTD